MSVRAIQWAFEQKVGRASMKLVLIALANYADEEGCCYPSTDSICEHTDLDRKTVLRVLGELRERGFIADTGARRGRTGQVIVHRLSLEKQSQKRNAKTVPKTERSQKRNSTVFSGKRSQKRYFERSQKRDTDTVSGTVREPSVYKRARDDESFKAFWAVYPRKRAKGAAEKAFVSALKRAPPEQIIEGARRYADERKGQDPKFTAHPATWLNADRWKDEPDHEHTRTLNADRIDAIISGRDPDAGNATGEHVRPALERPGNAGQDGGIR